MERRERMCGRCALLVASGLALIAGCGSGVLELLQAPSAMILVSDAGLGDALIERPDGPPQASIDDTTALQRNRAGEAEHQATETAATSANSTQPDRVFDAADGAQRTDTCPADDPAGGLQTGQSPKSGSPLPSPLGKGANTGGDQQTEVQGALDGHGETRSVVESPGDGGAKRTGEPVRARARDRTASGSPPVSSPGRKTNAKKAERTGE
ncbi:MAG: hypothetical protein JSU86_17265 [Phycisphaerales bacterium]|nr:MAG: hypothetical protein JSU86_17265 [Phycisphaerales bacterium]